MYVLYKMNKNPKKLLPNTNYLFNNSSKDILTIQLLRIIKAQEFDLYFHKIPTIILSEKNI